MHHQYKRKTTLVVVSCHRVPRASGRPLQDYPHHFPFPILISPHLGAHQSFLGLPAGLPVVGLHPKGKPRSCPASRPKKEPRDSERDNLWFVGQGDLTCLKEKVQEQHPDEAGRKTIAANFATGGVATIYRGNWHRVGSSVTRETRS